MSSSSAHQGFTKLGGGCYLRQGSSASEIPTQEPECVVLFSWMNGAPQHIAKYTDAYNKVFPKSSLLLVTSATSLFTKSQAENDKQLGPVVDWLRKSNLLKTEGSRLLVHSMSNGGAVRATNVARLLKAADAPPPTKPSRNSPPPPPIKAALPAHAYVLDSAPGRPRLMGFINAFTSHLAKAPLWKKLPYLILLPLLHWIGLLYRTLTGRKDSITTVRQELLDPSLFDQRAPRAYIYSPADQIIEGRDVEAHIADAKQMGGQVEAAVIKRSAHVSHMRTDPETYWATIKSIYSKG